MTMLLLLCQCGCTWTDDTVTGAHGEMTLLYGMVWCGMVWYGIISLISFFLCLVESIVFL